MDKLNRFHLAIKGLIVHNRKLLLLKKPRKPNQEHSCWELPGGGLVFGEMPETALQREIMEEINLKVDVIKPIWVWGFMKNESTQVVGITHLCRCDSTMVTISLEHEEFRWVAPEEIKELNLLPELREDMEKWDWNDIM
jgi:8-oxo-dGTP diphosphatase